MGTNLKNVLIVDPTNNLVETFEGFDDCRNWEMDHCRDSFSALQRLKHSTYDLVVMDHGIGPLNPFKLMDYVALELSRSLPMVIVGNGSEPEAVHENYLWFNYPIGQHHIDALVFNTAGSENVKERKLFSLDYLNQLSDNNQEFLEESIVLFRNTLDTRLKDLTGAISDLDFEEARQIAHNIKPSFTMMGNDNGSSICHTICYDASEREIPKLAEVLKNEYELIINEIVKQFPKLKVT